MKKLLSLLFFLIISIAANSALGIKHNYSNTSNIKIDSLKILQNIQLHQLEKMTAKDLERLTGKKMNFLKRLQFNVVRKQIAKKIKKGKTDLEDLFGMGPIGAAMAFTIIMGAAFGVMSLLSGDFYGETLTGFLIGMGFNIVLWATGIYPIIAGVFGLVGFLLSFAGASSL